MNYLFKQYMVVDTVIILPFFDFHISTQRMSFTNSLSLVMYLILTSAGDGVNSRPMILHDGSRATLHSQDARHLQDDVLRRGPAREGAREPHSNHLKEKSTA